MFLNTKLSEIDLLQLLVALTPYFLILINNRIPQRTNYSKDQFNKLLVPLMRVFKDKELNESMKDDDCHKRIKKLYIKNFQYAPDKLDSLINSYIINPNSSNYHAIFKECEFLFNEYRSKAIDTNRYKDRSHDRYRKFSTFFTYLYILSTPVLIFLIWANSLHDVSLIIFIICVFGFYLFFIFSVYQDKHKK